MDMWNVPLLASLILAVFALYKFIVYPAFISPLSKIPAAHPTCHISPAWILWKRFTEWEIRSIHAAHERLGPVIRIGPNEVSVNSVKGGLQTIYAGGFEKHQWYPRAFFNYGLPNMFSTATNKPHSARKRIISNIYSKSFLASSSSLKIVTQQLLHESFIPRLATYARCATPVDIYATFSGVTMDLVSGYMCGTDASTNFSDDIPARTHILDVFNSRPQYLFYVQEIPLITSLLQRLGIHLIPHRIDAANAEIEAWAMKIFDGARAALPNSPAGASNDSGEAARYPTVYAQLTAAMTKDPEKATIDPRVPPASTHLAIASECFDHLAAGFDTSGITLTYLVWELSQRPALQKALRDELLTLSPPLAPVTAEKPELPLFKALDALPLLQAILQETIRRHPAIPGPQPRVTPASESGTTLGPPGHEYAGIPAGVRVSCQAYSLHRNAAVFPEPEAWKPERWLNANGAVVSAEDGETAREMGRWFWGFGSGGRMCVGSNLAIYQMKYIVAAIYSNFETAIVNDTGIEQRDMYTAPPSGGKLIIRLTAV